MNILEYKGKKAAENAKTLVIKGKPRRQPKPTGIVFDHLHPYNMIPLLTLFESIHFPNSFCHLYISGKCKCRELAMDTGKDVKCKPGPTDSLLDAQFTSDVTS